MQTCKIDWDLLEKQKAVLVEIRSDLSEQEDKYDALSGIIHLLDELSDKKEAAII